MRWLAFLGHFLFSRLAVRGRTRCGVWATVSPTSGWSGGAFSFPARWCDPWLLSLNFWCCPYVACALMLGMCRSSGEEVHASSLVWVLVLVAMFSRM